MSRLGNMVRIFTGLSGQFVIIPCSVKKKVASNFYSLFPLFIVISFLEHNSSCFVLFYKDTTI